MKIMMKRKMVSVGMTVYNQEKFVAQAIESVLRQKTNFDFELVIAEDCSTDNSRLICIEYAKKYPEKIKLLLQKNNVGLKKQSLCLKKACTGVYRAHLEGDDFWIDDYKLQKQVDFLEAHKDYIAVSCKIFCVDESGKRCKFPYGNLENVYSFKPEYTLKDFQNWLLPSHTGALIYRNVFFDLGENWLNEYESYDIVGDRKTALMLVCQGKIKILPEECSVRRIALQNTDNFTHNMLKYCRHMRVCNWMDDLAKMGKEMFNVNVNFDDAKRKQWGWAMQEFKRKPNIISLKNVVGVFKTSNEKINYIKFGLGKVKNKLLNRLVNTKK